MQNAYDKRRDEILQEILKKLGGSLCVSVKQAAEIMGIAPQTFYNRRTHGSMFIQAIERFRPRLRFDVFSLANSLAKVESGGGGGERCRGGTKKRRAHCRACRWHERHRIPKA